MLEQEIVEQVIENAACNRDAMDNIMDESIHTLPIIHQENSPLFCRELSWISFNDRVLQEAANPNNPLLERVRFVAIASSNLDEFYMIRLASVRASVKTGIAKMQADGLTPRQKLDAINSSAARQLGDIREHWDRLLPLLAEAGISFVGADALSVDDRIMLEEKFWKEIFPLLTPLAIGPMHGFPFIPNKGLCLVLEMKNLTDNREFVALLLLPPRIARFHRLSGEVGKGDEVRLLVLEEYIQLFLHHLFPNSILLSKGCFRVLRDGDLNVDELDPDEDTSELLSSLELALKRRQRKPVVRLTIDDHISPKMAEYLSAALKVSHEDIHRLHGLLGLGDLAELMREGRHGLRFPAMAVRYPERVKEFGGDCLAAIRYKDMLIHHPYESFDVVVEFLRQAARDPNVLAIKQTLYRTSADSPIAQALIEAAENGKAVTALVELKARFDEEANLRWARDLERAGAQVVFGFTSYKTHAKISMVIRKEGNILRSYAHFGTGNYHPITAKYYTDLSFFTANHLLCEDVAKIFNYLTADIAPTTLKKLVVAPLGLRQLLIEKIELEIANALAGKPAQIWAKMNSLADEEIIQALYRASQAGVSIDLVVRGTCALRPGIIGLSENIRVKSLIGRFLEHARIVCFANGANLPSRQALVYLSSADWMARNFDRRVETLVPIENPTVHEQILDQIMMANLKDIAQSWFLHPNGQWSKTPTASLDHPQQQHNTQQAQPTPKNPAIFSAHGYFMNNPSLSGRGKALETTHPPVLSSDSFSSFAI
ncbi:MAG: RNA degradosome polyphosphate kinase [Alphaproteobacteria bacterium]